VPSIRSKSQLWIADGGEDVAAEEVSRLAPFGSGYPLYTIKICLTFSFVFPPLRRRSSRWVRRRLSRCVRLRSKWGTGWVWIVPFSGWPVLVWWRGWTLHQTVIIFLPLCHLFLSFDFPKRRKWKRFWTRRRTRPSETSTSPQGQGDRYVFTVQFERSRSLRSGNSWQCQYLRDY
jgi:hypothetical protein